MMMQTPQAERQSLAAWVVVGVGFFTLALSFSARASLGLAMSVWQREMGWPLGFSSTTGAVALLVMAAMAPLAGSWVDRMGPQRPLAGGLAAVGLGMLAVSLADSRWMLMVSYGVLAAVGFGFVANHVVATAIAGRFTHQRGLATGIGTSGATAGQLALVPLLAWVMERGNWRTSFLILGIACLVLIPVVLWALRGPHQSPSARAGEEALPPLKTRLAGLMRSKVFHLLFWSFTICGFTTTGAVETHLLPYAALCGFPPLPSATAYGVLCALNLAGMIAAGGLVDRVNRPMLLSTIYIVRGCSFFFLMVMDDDFTRLMEFAAVFGLFDYATVPVTASLVASHLGLRVMGLVMGLLATGHALGASAGALMGGWMVGQQGQYDTLWMVCLTLAIAAGLMVLLIRETPEEEENPETAAA